MRKLEEKGLKPLPKWVMAVLIDQLQRWPKQGTYFKSIGTFNIKEKNILKQMFGYFEIHKP